ncbi:MAG TPA: YciI family protein [Casimicrobiaceae bacterium]|jgi:hypothetical protein
MQYLLLIHAREDHVRSIDADGVARVMEAYRQYTAALKEAGVYLGSNRLQFTSTARTVRTRDGKTSVIDGPYTETKEQLGGYYLVDVPDEASAISWAGRCPGAAHGAIEVRPVWIM